ncbi:hypothetical protein DPMN_095321 [Dreissena polymorpha]|uniref:Uncharacterized protein n=1 Tax=Dreissena polymorpha TaxID=45954 RepID=A0A9D4L757_DREPO|nr:hypothetical protein DPMN_095321 [Dreissena polymorpha]
MQKKELDKLKISYDRMKGDAEKQKASYEQDMEKQKASFQKQQNKFENDIRDINLKLNLAWKQKS